MSLDSLYATLRKYEFPASAVEAIRHVHSQCQVFSKTGVPSPQEMNNLLEFIDEFVFCTSWGEGGGDRRQQGHPGTGKMAKKRGRKLSSVQQLQLLQVISDYAKEEKDFSLLCSVFMIMFMIQGRDPEYKLKTLSKLVSMSLGTSHLTLLNCTGLWLSQQTPTHDNSLAIANQLITDYISLVPNVEESLSYLPTKSPLLTANLLVSLGELYSRVGEAATADYSPPPISVVRLVTGWISNHPGLAPTNHPDHSSTILPMTGSSPVASLLKWTVMEPLVTVAGNRDSRNAVDLAAYSQLHYTILEILVEQGKGGEGAASVQPRYLTHLTESLLARLAAGRYPTAAVNLSLDRFGQILQALVGHKTVDRDLLALVGRLPPNRLVHIVVNNMK